MGVVAAGADHIPVRGADVAFQGLLEGEVQRRQRVQRVVQPERVRVSHVG